MSLQKDIMDKIVTEKKEWTDILIDLLIDIDEGKKTETKISASLLEDIRELVYEELGE